METERRSLGKSILAAVGVLALLLTLEYFGGLYLFLFAASIFLPYLVSALCVEGASPYMHDCIATALGSNTSSFGIGVTLLLVVAVSLTGIYFSGRLLIADMKNMYTEGMSGDWKGLALAVLLVCLGIAGIVLGAIYFHLI